MALRETLKRVQFQGTMNTDDESAAPALFTVEYELYDPSHLDMKMAFLGDAGQQRSATSQLHNLKWDHLTIHPFDTFFSPVEAFGLRNLSWSLDSASATPEELQYGIVDTAIDDMQIYYISVQLQPSGILSGGGMTEMSYTG